MESQTFHFLPTKIQTTKHTQGRMKVMFQNQVSLSPKKSNLNSLYIGNTTKKMMLLDCLCIIQEVLRCFYKLLSMIDDSFKYYILRKYYASVNHGL